MVDMNDTPPTDEPRESADEGGRGFESQNLRSIAAVRRSSDDRIVAGVGAGVARHLNIDPIIVRIGFVALTFMGLAGLILYLAAWFLLPADDEPRSVAADWFNLDHNEEQVRAVGLFVAAVLAVVAIVGDQGWGFWWIGWWLLPAAFLFWLIVVRPRRRREERSIDEELAKVRAAMSAQGSAHGSAHGSTQEQVDAYTAAKVADVLERKRARLERRRESRALRRLTYSLIAIAIAVTLIADRQVGLDNSAYFAAALVAVAVGCLVGTLWGSTAGLVPLGFLLTIGLALSSAVPSGPIGEQERAPRTLAGLQPTYRHGIGQFELDLGQFSRPQELAGKTVRIHAGIGQTLVYVPENVPVRVDAELRGGAINVFGREWEMHGPHARSDNEITTVDGRGRALHLVIDQRFGEMKVIRR
jgi:phage shock protein PspC (stress-responsive transcriptional regulator)